MGIAKRRDTVLYEVLPPVRRAHAPKFLCLTCILTEVDVQKPDMMVVNFVLLKTLAEPESIVVRREHHPPNTVLVIDLPHFATQRSLVIPLDLRKFFGTLLISKTTDVSPCRTTRISTQNSPHHRTHIRTNSWRFQLRTSK
jgi:hypothetical protein